MFCISCPKPKLINIANGIAVSEKVGRSLLDCHEQGNESRVVCDRLVTGNNDSGKTFFAHCPDLKSLQQEAIFLDPIPDQAKLSIVGRFISAL